MSGHQVAGCCVHVATLIFYLSYAKDKIKEDQRYIKLPASHLNSTLVNTKNLDISNEPRYVKHKRRKSCFIEKEIPCITSNSSDMSSEDEILMTNAVKKKILEPKDIEKNMHNDKVGLNKKKRSIQANNISKYRETPKLEMQTFISHIPSNGGYYTKTCGTKIPVINTCTIDNYLFALWVLSKLMFNFETRFRNLKPELKNTILEIIQNIDIYNWDLARQLWYSKVMKMNLGKRQKRINFFGTLERFFLQYMYCFQKHDLIQKCSTNCNNDGTYILGEHSELLHFWKKNNTVAIVTELTHKCPACGTRVICEIRFLDDPLFLFIETNSHFTINDLPKTIEINSKNYKLLCAIIYKVEHLHFVSIFDINEKKYLVDDLVKNEALLLEPNSSTHSNNYLELNISSAMYYMI